MLAAGFGGVVGTAADVAMLVLLVQVVGMAIPVAAFVAATVGAVVCYLMGKYVAFRDGTPVTLAQLARFGIVAVGSALLMALLMKLIAVDLHVPYLIAKLLCGATIFIAWTYPAQRRLVFVRRDAATA
ncbi:MAG: GtrA family protein [Kofleriaceae bacterium]